MNPAQHQSPPVSNPSTVMQMIESSCAQDAFPEPLRSDPRPAMALSSDDRPRLRLHIDSDTDHEPADLFDLNQSPTPQTEQLVSHLRTQQSELAQREADLQSQSYHWEQQVMASKSHLRKRTAELEHHIAQVQQQQQQLEKLQQSLIDGQLALRVVIERVVNDCHGDDLKLELAALKTELNQQFDVILGRWERVASLLQAS